jgi:hypothetical protein
MLEKGLVAPRFEGPRKWCASSRLSHDHWLLQGSLWLFVGSFGYLLYDITYGSVLYSVSSSRLFATAANAVGGECAKFVHVCLCARARVCVCVCMFVYGGWGGGGDGEVVILF